MPAEEGRCIKCGRPTPADASLCDVCNRARMATPSASQYHGTIAVAIVAGVIALAVAATLAVRGVGPYRASVIDVTQSPGGGIEVGLEIVNEGTRSGRVTCQLVALDATGRRLGVATTTSPTVEGGATAVFSERLPSVSEEPDRVTVRCG